MTVSGIVSRFPAVKTSFFLYTLCPFDRGELGQRDGVHVHSVWIVVGARGGVIMGRGVSLSKVSDAY